MSVSVEPPLHFSQQTSSPSFSSPPQSPTHVLHAQTPLPASPPPLPPPATDVDMTTSVNTLPPTGQPHDREDSDMQEGAEVANNNSEESTNTISDSQAAPSAVAVEVAAVDEDAMDTTPDTGTLLIVPSGSTDSQEALLFIASTAAEGGGGEITDSVLTGADATQAETSPQLEVSPPTDDAQLPPPHPPIEPVHSESDSSDDDDGLQPWHPIQEDTSSPDEDELKEITASAEHSALDHEYWESKAFLPLEEPEYTAGASGRIEWTIDPYNGTREKPNRDIVMKSEAVTIGGYQWQIKFYPKGNDSDYLSVYLECLSVMDQKSSEDEKKSEDSPKREAEKDGQDELIGEPDEKEAMLIGENDEAEKSASAVPVENQHTPLPLLGSKVLPKRKSVAAQVSVVLYNPTEPRVHYSRTALHRFCSGSPDWGWTRFHGPYYDIAHRMRGQRQALLRHDKLAFTGYVRIVDDETNCLWEHHSQENPWDSFAMTGLQGLMLGEDASAPGGNMISAIASWMMFKPFRDLLYSINIPDPNQDFFAHPKPLISALQKVLYMLRTQVDPGAGAIVLDDVLDALEWYGIHNRLDKLDVVETWEVVRAKLEEELQATPHAHTLEALFGPKRDYSTGTPSYRVPVVDVESMQEAINKSTNVTLPGQPLPQLLTIELERQGFDLKTRSYVKLLNKVTLDEQVSIDGTAYTLFGFVVHKQTLQSYVYQPILRPEGPGSRWYSFSDSKDQNQVRCLTKRQALDAHEGKAGTGQVLGNDAVAYVAMYVRNDAAHSTFVTNAESEQWNVPQWILAETDKSRDSDDRLSVATPPLEQPTTEAAKVQPEVQVKPPKVIDFQVFGSEAFALHEGPGFFDVYDPRLQDHSSNLIHTVQLSSTDGCKEIREKLISVLPNIQDPRQVKFWFLDPVQGSFGRPTLLGTGKIEFSSGSYDRYTDGKLLDLEQLHCSSRAIWVHVIDFENLPELPKVEELKEPEIPEEVTNAQVVEEQPAETDHIVEPTDTPMEMPPQQADTPMSEPDESAVIQPEASLSNLDNTPPEPAVQGVDTAMEEMETASTIVPPAVEVPIPNTLAPNDTEMGGTQEELPVPPPPPGFSATEVMRPPSLARAMTPEPPPEEIYFFLKFWNPATQTLEARGSHICPRSARVDETVVTLLALPSEDKKRIEILEEEELTTTRTIKHRRTFAQLDLQNGIIIIVAYPQSDEQRSTLAERAAFADLQAYLEFRAFSRNFPHKMNGHFTYNYFSSQYYKGEIKNGHRHGHGTRIYHSGATYEGTFRLGQRYGHGLYTFQNGDAYDGDWVNNQQHGSGTFVEAATGNTYVGGWKNDKKFGEGVTHWKNAQEAERMCRICWDEPAEAAFYDCGHVVACLTCAREVQTCPVCRKRVLSAMKLYYVA